MNRMAKFRDVTFVMSINLHLFRKIQGVPYHLFKAILSVILGRMKWRMAKVKGKLTQRNLIFTIPKPLLPRLVGTVGEVPTLIVGVVDATVGQNFKIFPSKSDGTKNLNLHYHQKIQNWQSALLRKFPMSFSLLTKVFHITC